MNLFLSLAQWATRQDENVLTEAFVCLIHHLRERQPEIGNAFLSWVCFGDNQQVLPTGMCVETQQSDELGRPDVWVEAEDVLCLIEVKKWSGFGTTQLDRYQRLLSAKPHRLKRLILLTARPVHAYEIADIKTIVHVHCLRWPDVAVRLEGIQFSDPIASFLATQFVGFLRAEGLKMESIHAKLVDGCTEFKRLLGVIQTGLTLADIPIYHKTGGWGEWVGWYLNHKRYTIGIGYERSHLVQFRFHEAKHDLPRFKALGRGSIAYGKPLFELDLSSPELGFFELPALNQLDIITAFCKAAYADCIAITEPPNSPSG